MMKKNEVVKVNNAVQVPAGIDLASSAAHASNEKLELRDQVLPWLKVVQKSSPELDNTEEFPGLAFGDLLIAGEGGFWSGQQGLVFVPFYYGRTYVEWCQRHAGGGFVADHGLLAGRELSKKCRKAEGKKVATVLENGNELVETAYWAGFIVSENEAPVEAVFSMSSTFLSVSREWNTKVIKYRIPEAPNYIRWARPWRITTHKETNDAGTWAKPVVSLYRPADAKVDVYHTFDLPNGISIWKACEEMATTFASGFRLSDNDDTTSSEDLPF